jgi:two-component system NtrC family sensor kinase
VRVHTKKRKSDRKLTGILPLGFGAALGYWIVDSLIHSFLLHDRSFIEAFLLISPHELWMRLLTVAIIIGVAFLTNALINRRGLAERALWVSEKKFRTMFESASDIIAYLDTSGTIVDINPRIEDVMGYTPGELIGKNIAALGIYPEGTLSYVSDSFARVKKGEPATGHRLELRHKDGRAVFLENSTVAIEDDGVVSAVLVTSRDVTEREKSEERLRVSEERYRHLLETITDAVTVVDREWRHVLVNGTAERLLGIPKEELLERTVTDVLPGVEHTEFFKTMRHVMETREAGVVSGEFTFRNGREGCYEVHVYPAEEGILCITSDITERVKMEEKLRAGEESWNCLVSNTDDTVIIADGNDVIEYINRTFPPWTPQDMIGKKLSDYVSGEHQDLLRKSLRQVRETGRPTEYEIIVEAEKISSESGIRWFRTTAVPMTSEGGTSRLIMISADITERKRTNDALKESEERLMGIINSSPDAILVCDTEGTVVQCNEAALKAHGFTSEADIVGFSLMKLIAPASRQTAGHLLRDVPERGVVRDTEIMLVTKDGREFPAEVSGSAVRDAEGRAKYLVGVAKDVTERKKVETELWDATEKWTSLMDNTSDIVTVMDIDGRVQYTNRALPPYSAEDTIGQTIFEYIGKEQHSVMADTLERVFKTGETENYEMRSDIVGIGPRWFSAKMVPVKRDGEVISVITIASDVTERKRAEEERERLRQQLAYAEKMESLGHLARGVAHEINNPLTSVLATAELVLDEMSGSDISKSDIEQIVNEARRIQDTVRSFLGFAKARDFALEKSDINAIMTTALRAVGKAQLRDCEVITHYDTALPSIEVSKFHVQEVFVNLITNALHSMRDGGTLTVTSAQEDDSVVVSIKDTGVGIREEDLSKIFEPYFTTREKRGTGLGLSICRDIVMRHGGRIEVNSEGSGRGAEFRVHLPK